MPDVMPADLLDAAAVEAAYSHRPCRKSGPSREDAAAEAVPCLAGAAADEGGVPDGGEAALTGEVADIGAAATAPGGAASRAGEARAARKVKVLPGVRIGPVGKLLVRILEHYPKRGEIYISSAYRNEPGSHHGGRTYRDSPTAALDIAAGGKDAARRMRDVAKWL